MKLLPAQAFRKLASLYADMQGHSSAHAQALGLTCDGCPQNCCTSFFQHHTRVEWAYLLQGLSQLPADRRAGYEERARAYVRDATAALDRGKRPSSMCPLNDDGRCGLYAHRLMICRLHGVPNRLRYPDGRTVDFPGCFRSQEICTGTDAFPVLDRTVLYTRLMELEVRFVGPGRIRALPRVDLTLAEMIVQGSPTL
jgi:hypothetical protein